MSNTISGLNSYFLPNTLDNLSFIDDVSTSFLLIDGTNSMLADLDMGNHNIKNLDLPTTNDQATNKLYVDNAIVSGLTNYVTLNTNQTITGTKLFYDNVITGDGQLALGRATQSNARTIKHLDNVSSVIWSVGNESEGNEDYIFYKNGTTPIVTINYTTPALSINNYKITNLANATNGTDALNLQTANSRYVDLISTQFVGGNKIFTESGSGYLAVNRSNTSNFAYIQFWTALSTKWRLGMRDDTTENFHFTKDGTTNIMTINYTTPSLSMNNYKIINLLDPTNAQDAATKSYVDSHTSGNYVTLSTNQTITGIKTFTVPGAFSFININRDSTSGTSTIRYESIGTDIWEVGMAATTNTYYWYHVPTALAAMTLTTSGRLGIGTNSPSDKLQVENGSMVMNRTDTLPCLLNMTSNSNSSALGSVISQTSITSRATGIKFESSTNTNIKWFWGRPYDTANPTDSRVVLGYVSTAGQDPAIERTDVGVRQYTPIIAADGTNSRLGINTITPAVPCHITGNTRITSGTLDMTTNKVINIADGTTTADAINFGQWKNGKVLNVSADFSYDNEDFILLFAGINRTITFPNITYYNGKRFEIIIANNGLFARTVTFNTSAWGFFPDGTTSKVININPGAKRRFSCVIENLFYNNLYVSELSYL